MMWSLLSWLIVITMGLFPMGMEPPYPFPTNQSQADILCVFKNLVAAQPFCVWYKYVQSHADDTKRWQDCLLKEQINIKVDSLAKKALMAAHSIGKCIKSAFPNEQIWICMGGERWRVPCDPSWRNSGAGPPLKSFSTKRNCLICSFWLCLVARVWTGYLQISKNIPAIHHKTGFWMVQLQLQTLTLGRGHHQQMPTVRMQSRGFKTSN